MKAIKAAVIGMGILIVIGIGLVGYGISQKMGSRAAKPEAAPAVAVPEPEVMPSEPANPGAISGTALINTGGKPMIADISLNQPEGSRVINAGLFGRRVVVTVEGGGRPPRVLIVDLNSGDVLSTISLSQ